MLTSQDNEDDYEHDRQSIDDDDLPDYSDEEDDNISLRSRRRQSVASFRALDDENNYELIRTAQQGLWPNLDVPLRRMRRRDPRINVQEHHSGKTLLMMACRDSRTWVVERLCDLGADVNILTKDLKSALHYAAENGNEKILDVLLKHKANANIQGGEHNRLPLHISAMLHGHNLAYQKNLLKACVKDGALLVKDRLGNLPITYAVNSGSQFVVHEFLQHNALEQLLWTSEATGDHLTHAAARNRNVEIMKMLFHGHAAKVNINAQNKTGQTPLHIAAKLGDLAMLRLLHSFNAHADILDKKHQSPMHLASKRGHADVIRLLVETFKASFNIRTKDGSTLMHMAAEYGHDEVVKTFIRLGIPVNMANKAGILSLHCGAMNGHLKVVSVLVRNGSKIDSRTKDGYTPLHLAVLSNQPLIIEELLGFGAKVDIRGGPLMEASLHMAAKMPNGFSCAEMLLQSGATANNTTEETLDTALHIAARQGSGPLVKLLLEEGANPSQVNKSGETPLHISARHCHFDVVKAIVSNANSSVRGKEASNLINMANNEGETAFHIAAEMGKSQAHEVFEEVDIIRILLDNGADPLTATMLTNETSLHYCARSGNSDILNEIVRHLGSSVFQMACNRQDKMGWSPLMTACEQGHSAVADVLLSQGARADVFDEYGKAALHLAAENGHISCCEILLSFKAFVNAKSKLGLTPLHFAAQNGFKELVNLLTTKYHAAVNALSLDNQTPLHFAAKAGRRDVCHALLNLQGNASASDSLGQTPLHLAAESDHAEVVKCFMKFRPQLLTVANKAGMTCSHVAANFGSVNVIKELARFNKTLITSLRNAISDSLPIHLAVSGGHREVVRALINAGASTTDENAEGMTAIHLAAMEGSVEVLQSIPHKVSLETSSLKNGLSAIHVAAFYGNTEIVYELQARVDINSKTRMPEHPNAVNDPQLRALISHDYGLTPLHMASFTGKENVVRLILNSPNLSINEQTLSQGRMPLSFAAQNGHHVVVSLLLARSSEQLASEDNKGRQPLHFAAENGQLDVFNMLLTQGARVNSADDDGWTPLHFAAKNGFLKLAQVIIDSGGSPMNATIDGKTPLVISTANYKTDLLHFFLTKEHDTDQLLEDNAFLIDLMICGKSNFNESVDEFVLHSPAPLYTAAKLSVLFHEISKKEKERAKDLSDASRYCEHMTTKLLGIATGVSTPSVVLRAIDTKGTQFLDTLLEHDMKEVVSHASVQRYLSDIWAGRMTTWPSYRFLLLFLAFLVPPICAYFCFPFKHHHFHHIPVVKFFGMIVSHIYLILLLSIIAAIPIDPIIYRDNFLPNWYELLCLAIIAGMIVAELTKSGSSTGLGVLRYVIIFFAILAVFMQMAAIAFDELGDPKVVEDTVLNLMYGRNFMLSFSLFAAIILILDFLLIHHLFGPFGIIISNVTRDLMLFFVVLLLFAVGITMMLCCVYSPLQKEGSEYRAAAVPNNNEATTPSQEPLLKVSESADDEASLTEDSPPSRHVKKAAHWLVSTGIVAKTTHHLKANKRRKRSPEEHTNAEVKSESQTAKKCRKVPKQQASSHDATDADHKENLLKGEEKHQAKKTGQKTELKGKGADEAHSIGHGASNTKKTTKGSNEAPRNVLDTKGTEREGKETANKGKMRKVKNAASSHGESASRKEAEEAGESEAEEEEESEAPAISNRYWSTLVILFSTLYFSMFAMGKPQILPVVENGAEGSFDLIVLYFGMWMIVSVITLIPLLIAMLTDTYKQIHQRSDLEWKFSRAKLIRNMVKMSPAPSPMNLIARPYLYLRALKKHRGMMFSPYTQFYIDEEEQEGAEEAEVDEGESIHHQHSQQDSSCMGRLKSCCFRRNKVGNHEANTKPDHEELAVRSVSRHSERTRRQGLERMEEVLDWSIAIRHYRGVVEEPSENSSESNAGLEDDEDDELDNQLDEFD